MAARYYTKTQGTQLNNHLPCHLSQPTHLGTQPKATLGMNRQLTIYNRNIQQTMVPVDRMVSEEQIFQLMDSFGPFEYPTSSVFRSSLLVFKLIRDFKKRVNFKFLRTKFNTSKASLCTIKQQLLKGSCDQFFHNQYNFVCVKTHQHF